MRVTSDVMNHVQVKAYAGTTGALLAFDVDAVGRKGLLGFAVEREILSGSFKGTKKWLESKLNYPGIPHAPGSSVPSNVAPFPKFRWSDYTVYPGTDYGYTVHPLYGKPGTPTVGDGPSLSVSTAQWCRPVRNLQSRRGRQPSL